VNPARGEVQLVTREGRFVLCLTLGALAEIEAVLGSAPPASLRSAPSPQGGGMGAAEMLAVLRALLRGGGEWRAAREAERLTLEPRAAAEAIAACFQAAL
jgi:hypothetical protein